MNAIQSRCVTEMYHDADDGILQLMMMMMSLGEQKNGEY